MTLILDDGAIDRNWVRSPTGLILSEDAARLRYAPPRHPQGGDIFSGCGGASCGFKAAGIQVRFAVEWETNAALTYMVNLGAYPCEMHFQTAAKKAEFEKALLHKDPKTGLVTIPTSGSSGVMARYAVPGTDHMWVWDVRKLTGKMLLDPLGMAPGDLDILHGSPPCQGFSTANKNRSSADPRNNLMLEYARLITELKPKTFTMEQVPNVLHMTTADGQPMLDAFFDCIEASGYATRVALEKMVAAQGGKDMLLRRAHPNGSASEAKPARRARRTAPKSERASAPIDSIGAILNRLRGSGADVSRVTEAAE